MKKNFQYQLNRGQAMLTATILFLVVSITIIFGLVDPVARETRSVADLHSSRRSYFLSEAGMEDVVYRLKNGMEVTSAGEVLSIDGESVTTVVTDVSGGKTVSSEGDWNSHIRKIEARLVTGIGVAFNYGVQTGQGGFTMSNNAGVNGNVYSNGDISGASGAYVTGSAIASGGLINRVTVGVGTVGDAWANNVTNSTIRGALYCQTGTSNNKSCNTSRPDPEPAEFPITDENIETWKDEALSGGTLVGNQHITGTATIIGPKKIEGNLTFSNNAILTVSGTLWITGNITTANNVVVKLASSYGSGSGVIVTDGRVVIQNNVSFQGSGATESHILLLTTSTCPTGSCGGANAISVGNNAGTVILNAQNGTISFSNNAGAKEATAKTISLSNNAIITYDTGLQNVNFVSGPGGGWDIRSWKEVE